MGETTPAVRVGTEDSFTLSTEDSEKFTVIDMQYHQEEFSQIETNLIFDHEKRRQDDIITWLAEVLPGTMATAIEYELKNNELVTEDGQIVGEIFDDALTDAQRLPSELAFERRRRKLEKSEYQDMVKMAKGELLHPNSGEKINTIVVESDFPPELINSSKDLVGYNVKRKTTMQRVIVPTKKGIKVITHSLDGSNRKALESVYKYCGYKPQPGELLGQRMYLSLTESQQELLPVKLRHVYDTSLAEQFGGNWHGGRAAVDQRNTYSFIWENYDLISHYLNTTNSFTGGITEYSLAAAMTQRFNQKEPQKTGDNNGFSIVKSAAIQDEFASAAKLAMIAGQTFSGCGASLSGEKTKDSNTREGLVKLGYGNLSIEDQYGPLDFECQYGHANTRQFEEIIPKCRTCGVKVACIKPDKKAVKAFSQKNQLINRRRSRALLQEQSYKQGMNE